MSGRTIFRVFAVLVVIALAIGIGASVYNAGVTAGLAESARAAAASGDPVTPWAYGYGPYWHGGFGFFGIFFWILGIFLLFALLRAAFGGGRWGGGPRGPSGWGGRREMLEELHREMHRRERTDGPAAG